MIPAHDVWLRVGYLPRKEEQQLEDGLGQFKSDERRFFGREALSFRAAGAKLIQLCGVGRLEVSCESFAHLLTLVRSRFGVKRDDGQVLIEYALIVSLIALISIVALSSSGVNISSLLHKIAGEL